MYGSEDKIEYNKHTQSDGDIPRDRSEFEIEEDEHEEEFEQSEDQENNDVPEEIQELNDFIKRFPNFFVKHCIQSAKDGILDIEVDVKQIHKILNCEITNKTRKDIKYLKELQACAVCEVLDKGHGLCDLCISDCIDSNGNVLTEKVDEILLNSEKAFTAYWFPSQNLRSDLVNNVNDNKYFFVKFNSNNKLLIDATFKNKDEEEKKYTIPLSMDLAKRFTNEWYSELNKHKDKTLQDRFGAIMQYLDYSLRSYSLYNKDENKTQFNDAADFVLKGIVEPCYDLLRIEIFSNAVYAVKDVSYRYSILNLVRMYELCRDLHVTPTVAVMKYVNGREYYLGNGLVTEEGMQSVLNKYGENYYFANKQKKSQNISLHQSENDNSENSDNENNKKENNSKIKFNSFSLTQEDEEEKKNAMQSVAEQKIIRKKIFKNLDIPDIPEITFKNRETFKKSVNQENPDNSDNQDLENYTKKSKNGTTKPVVKNMSSSPPQLNKKQSVKQQPTLQNHSVSGGTKSQPVNNKPAETNKSDKSNKVEDPSTQKKFKEKSEDKKDVQNKAQNVKDKQNKKINNTKSKLNNEEQKNQTSNAYTYLFIALGVIVVSVIAFFIYRNFVSNVASLESLQNHATNLLSV